MRRLTLWLAAVLLALPALAQTEATIKRTLEERLQGLRIQSVTRTPYAGLWEIRTEDNEIVYTDEKASFIFVGSIRDARDPARNLTEERIQQLTAVKFSELPLNQAFKIVRGNGRRQLAYFTDPNCPYCRQLERELLQLDDVTLHIFLYPILAADSMPKARAVWCSSDKVKTWNALMLEGVQPPPAPAGCDAPIEKTLALGQKLRVRSVPTLVLANGVRIPGYKPARELSKLIDDAAGK